VLLATRCPVCDRVGPAPCAGCIAGCDPPPRRPPPVGVDRLAAALAYVGPGRELVARLKYRNRRAVIGWLATAMAVLVEADGLELVTWVPTTRRRRRQRGFDHAQLLARAVAARLGLPCRAVLVRAPGPPQTGRTLADRRLGPSFTVRGCPPAAVLVVDDVITSGATLAAATRALRAAGTNRVDTVVAASTPLKPGASRSDH
jgi:predicted amidophosphoribosyltransferase